MENRDIWDLVRRIIDLVRIDRGDEDETLVFLSTELDHLAAEVQALKWEINDLDYEEPPTTRDQFLLQIRDHFPALSAYRLPERLGSDETGVYQADAGRDLAVILDHLTAVLWCVRNTSENHAMCYLQLSYRSEWGRYLRGLQLFLFDKLY